MGLESIRSHDSVSVEVSIVRDASTWGDPLGIVM